jgi:hypothetical protein
MRTGVSTLTLSLIISLVIAGCTSSAPSNPDDGRPAGTWRVRILFDDQCVFTDQTKGYVYSDFKSIGGELLYEVAVEQREINLFLQTGEFVVLEVRDGDHVLVDETKIYGSDRDIQREPPLACQ